ncbi:MAG: FAD-dependent oxidoreductase [Coriobacteriales bacterium]|jgi:fumarate reductase flavoprotein subunit|nr:FAD-dependent oxidoreductase [Coriobacteriales bacterium]
MRDGLSRRDFMKGSLIGAAAMGTGLLAACAPQDQPTVKPEDSAEASVSTQTGDGTYSFETPPPPISDDQISKTLETEFVIVGAGAAGCCAALTAAEQNAKVIVLQKHSEVFTNGGGFAAYNSKMQQAAGADFDVQKALNRWMEYAENRARRDMLNVWVRQSGPTIDWVCEKLEGSDVGQPVGNFLLGMEFDDWETVYPVMHSFARYQFVIEELARQAQDLGVEFLFETPGVQLEKDEGGRVASVIARQGESYIRVKASKGILLCTGDYGANLEIRKKWMPHSADLMSPVAPAVNTGDGLLMSLWIGADIDRAPHPGSIHYDLYIEDPTMAYGSMIPWLNVDKNGKRYCNEDMNFGLVYGQDLNLKDLTHYQVFDADYETYYPNMGNGLARSLPTPPEIAPLFREALQKEGIDDSGMSDYQAVIAVGVHYGSTYEAQSIEELAGMIGCPADELEKTIARYNELYEKGVDEDYGKMGTRLSAIKTPPFYAIPRKAYMLGTLGGTTINTNMQVLTPNGEIIEGLYAAGNNSGGYFFGGMVQPMCMPGMTIARASMQGRLAALHALTGSY